MCRHFNSHRGNNLLISIENDAEEKKKTHTHKMNEENTTDDQMSKERKPIGLITFPLEQ